MLKKKKKKKNSLSFLQSTKFVLFVLFSLFFCLLQRIQSEAEPAQTDTRRLHKETVVVNVVVVVVF